MQLLASRRAYHHPTRDLAVTHLAEDPAAVERFLALGVQPLALARDRPANGAVSGAGGASLSGFT